MTVEEHNDQFNDVQVQEHSQHPHQEHSRRLYRRKGSVMNFCELLKISEERIDICT